MKLKFPKQIKVGDQYYLVVTNKRKCGGGFYNYDDTGKKMKGGVLNIGTKLLDISPSCVLTTIIHELIEILCVSKHIRYHRPDCQEAYEFHYTHREHDDLCSTLSGLLDEFIK